MTLSQTDMLDSMLTESNLFPAAVPSGRSSRPDLDSLLHYLYAVGLSAEEKTGDDNHPRITCHELVRERIRRRMQQRSDDRAGSTEDEIRIEYGRRLRWLFQTYRTKANLSAAMEAGRLAIVYFVEAQSFDRVADFGWSVIINAGAPRLLSGLLPHLEVAAQSAPQGRDGWRCNQILADALDNAGRSDESLPFFARAATMPKSAAEAAGENADEIWEDYSTIVGNWSIALQHIGDLVTARQQQLERAEALRKAHAPAVNIISSEVEILRLDISEGKAAQVLGELENRVAKMAEWWSRSRTGESVPEAPHREHLAQFYLNALDADREARVALRDWEGALRRSDETVRVAKAVGHPAENIAVELRNRAVLLTQLRRYPEAKAALEVCLEVFKGLQGIEWVILRGHSGENGCG
jgi:tetratricopeptide (TPR) repeat protein